MTEVEDRFAAKAPFPWFGGKSKAAPLVWQLLGDVDHYVEPFAGSLAVLLNRPHECNRSYFSETVNDLDGFVVNAWRAIQMHPVEVARAASWPVAEADKTARQIALLRWRDQHDLERLMGDPLWCDPLIAGWWLWAVSVQIGAFTGDGPWTVDMESGRVFKQPSNRSGREPGVSRELPHLTNNGRGVTHATLREPGVSRDRPHLTDNGQGVAQQTLREPRVTDLWSGQVTVDDLQQLDVIADTFHDVTMPKLVGWMRLLSARLRHVRILNGDWKRAVTPAALKTLSVRSGKGVAGVFLDPPYSNDERSHGLYAHDDGSVARDVFEWALANGDDPKLRIVVAGFDTEHQQLVDHGWTVHEWYTSGWLTGGYKKRGGSHQMHRDRLWASPHCLPVGQEAQLQAAGPLFS